MGIRRSLSALTFCISTFLLVGSAEAQSENVNLISNLDSYHSAQYADIWGYSAPNGTELAILGVRSGTSFIDVTNPASPTEVLWIPGSGSIWRDIKTYDTYAYIVDDQAGEGLIVVDLSNPTSPVVVRTRTTEFFTAHNIFIDEDAGLAFCCGGSSGSPYTYIYDLTIDPSDPQPIYNFDDIYCHDLYTLNGVAYLGAVYAGLLVTVDISNLPASMPILDTLTTDDAFTHNVWTTEDGAYALTTDERSGGHLTIVDVSDPSDIFKVGEYNHPTDTQAIIHNVCIENGLAHVSWYRNGYEVVDISNPTAPERVGFYDTFPGGGDGFDGAWGVYPYADNGLIYVSDIQTGLYVFEFDPSFGTVEGYITDAATTNPIEGATITIGSEERTSNADGFYKFNIDAGAYTVEVEAFSYVPESFGVNIVEGQTSTGDEDLDRVPGASLSGYVVDSPGDLVNEIVGAEVEVLGTPFSAITDGDGEFAFEFVPEGTYDVVASAFGYGSNLFSKTIASGTPASLAMWLNQSAIVDDMEANNAWTTGGTGSTGEWTRGNPNGSGGGTVQPEDDHTAAPGTDCYFTGQASPGDGVGTNDIDDGTQILTSPVFNLTGSDGAIIRYYRWYVNDGNGSVDDVFQIHLSDDAGDSWTLVETLTTSRAFWEKAEILVSDHVELTDEIQIRFTAADEGSGSIVEAAIDDFEIYIVPEPTTSVPTSEFTATRLMGANPNPFSAKLGGDIRFQLASAQEVNLSIVDVQGRRVAILASGMMNAGTHSVTWDGTDGEGHQIPTGVYFQRLSGTDLSMTKKLVVLP